MTETHNREELAKSIEKLLTAYNHEDAQQWAQLLARKSPQMRHALLRQLVPEAFLEPETSRLHDMLDVYYPELLTFLEGSTGYWTVFPEKGIPAQAYAIEQHVNPRFNAGIGVAKTPSGDILMNPLLGAIFDRLRPNDIDPDDWRRVRNTVFKYNHGLGAPWYRQVAYLRYMRDGRSDRPASKLMERVLRIKPIPIYGGTTGLTVAFGVALGSQMPIVLPSTYWGNINLKIAHEGAIKVKSEYLDQTGTIRPEKLWETLDSLKRKGYRKAAIYFNFPHNPIGIVPTREQAAEFQDVVQGMATPDFRIAVFVDEAYYPFVRGDDAIRVPFSYYMNPVENRNIITFVSINGTKRDGVYGMRHSDLIVLAPATVPDKGIELLEQGVVAGYMRGTFSFSSGLNQYFIARALTGDPLVPLRQPWDITLSEEYFAEEKKIADYMADSVEKTLSHIDTIEQLERVTGTLEKHAYGGFFATFRLSGAELRDVQAFDVHKAGLHNECGVIATSGFLRINGLITEDSDEQFKANLRKSIETARLRRGVSGSPVEDLIL